MNNVTMQEFKTLCTKILEEDAKKKELEAKAKEISKPLLSLQFEAVEYMKELGIDAIEVEGYKFSTKFRAYAKIVDYNALKNYLKSTGQFDDLATINAATFKKFYEIEKEKAVEREDVDWNMSGVEVTSSTTTLSFKKAK